MKISHKEKLYITVAEDFSFKSTVFSHGWADLLPFTISEDRLTLSYTLLTDQKNVYDLQITSLADKKLEIKARSDIREEDRQQILKVIRRIFRLEEDYSQFYRLAESNKEFSWVVTFRAGRMLRSGSLWEDMVKMLCTTNCTWRLTQIMTENLVHKLGAVYPAHEGGRVKNAFPDAHTVAAKNEAYLRDEIKMGYRAPYLLEFAGRIAGNALKLEEFEDKQIPTYDLYQAFRGIKGFGDYAVSNLLKLLGRYDFLGADSWSRQKFADKHNKGKKCADDQIAAFYKKFGAWAGLFFWMDVSEDWYRREKPW